MKKIIWIAREFDENSDYLVCTFDHDKAADEARQLYKHLTRDERATKTVSVEGYPVELPDDDTRSASQIWDDLCDTYDGSAEHPTANPTYCEEVKE